MFNATVFKINKMPKKSYNEIPTIDNTRFQYYPNYVKRELGYGATSLYNAFYVYYNVDNQYVDFTEHFHKQLILEKLKQEKDRIDGNNDFNPNEIEIVKMFTLCKMPSELTNYTIDEFVPFTIDDFKKRGPERLNNYLNNNMVQFSCAIHFYYKNMIWRYEYVYMLNLEKINEIIIVDELNNDREKYWVYGLKCRNTFTSSFTYNFRCWRDYTGV
jgi:hypothetical protein